jgi:hypothetical protein
MLANTDTHTVEPHGTSLHPDHRRSSIDTRQHAAARQSEPTDNPSRRELLLTRGQRSRDRRLQSERQTLKARKASRPSGLQAPANTTIHTHPAARSHPNDSPTNQGDAHDQHDQRTVPNTTTTPAPRRSQTPDAERRQCD